jgi:prepilin-type N-terminal cleavage/methylation domain-containing protein
MNRRGFTLIELLVVVSIIGTLATAGMVSYSSVRATARDAKRMSDARQLQAALEIYYENHDSYPPDGVPGPLGLLVGETDGWSLTDQGFSPVPKGQTYMLKLPKNALPYGAPYVYRSLDADGHDCDSNCPDFRLMFFLEKGANDFKGGVHSISAQGITEDPHGYDGTGVTVALPDSGNGLEAGVDRYATQVGATAKAFVNDPRTKTVAEKAVAPAASVFAIINTAAASGSQLYHFFLFLVQPLQLLRRKRYRAWGTVYNSLTHLPEDLAIVRLFDARNKILRSQVTDMQGRFAFMVSPGQYSISVAKVGYAFPSRVAAGKTEDGPFQGVYTEGRFEIMEESVLAPNIPIDPPEASDVDAAAVGARNRKERRHNAAVVSLGLGIIAFALRPTVLTGLLFALQIVLYSLFKRLAEPPEPKNWGVVFDQETEKPIANAIVRIFEGKYNKLLESQVTDRIGRYHFRVGSNTYYLTVTRHGYFKTETAPLDLTKATGATVIASDLPLKRNRDEAIKAPMAKASGPGQKLGQGAGLGGSGTVTPTAAASAVPPATPSSLSSAPAAPASPPARAPQVSATPLAAPTSGSLSLEGILGSAAPVRSEAPSAPVEKATEAIAPTPPPPAPPASPIIAMAQAMAAKAAAEKVAQEAAAPPEAKTKKAWFRD